MYYKTPFSISQYDQQPHEEPHVGLSVPLVNQLDVNTALLQANSS